MEYTGTTEDAIVIFGAWREETRKLTPPDKDRNMDVYSYYSEDVLLAELAKVDKSWFTMFGQPTVTVGNGNTRIVTVPLLVMCKGFKPSILYFWGVGEGTAPNGCHVLGAATTARRQALLNALGWVQSSASTDAENIKEKGGTARKEQAAAQVEQEEPEKQSELSPARQAYLQAKTVADLAKSRKWPLIVTEMGLDMDDIRWAIPDYKTSELGKDALVEFMNYCKSARLLIPDFVTELRSHGVKVAPTVKIHDLSVILGEVLETEEIFDIINKDTLTLLRER